jgi:hypothetical protein
MTFSTDRTAEKWAEPRVIDETVANSLDSLWLGPHHVQGAVAVNSRGVIGISWAARNGAQTDPYMPRFIASVDGGETWTHSVDLAPQPSRMSGLPRRWTSYVNAFGFRKRVEPIAVEFASSERAGHDVADFWGIMADAAGVFHPVWMDTRTGQQQLWTAAVTVHERSYALREVTDQVRIRFGESAQDSLQKTLRVDVSILNTSGKPIRGPFILKRVPIITFMGASSPPDNNLIATNADNGWGGPGAVWTLSAKESAVLAPGEQTISRRILFRMRTNDAGEGADNMHIRVFVRSE